MIRQRGVILISVLILVALAAIIATALFFETAMSARRTASSFAMEQAVQLGQGAESLAANLLSDDKPEVDSLDEDWAMPYGPFEVDTGVSLEAQLTDEEGKFNINSMMKPDGSRDDNAIKVFSRLLTLSGLDSNWAELIVDWIDTDTVPGPGGGEDSLYIARKPPHLTGNQTLTSISELQQIPQFTPALYAKLAPHITALPPNVRQINVCTADGFVLDALYALSATDSRHVEHSQRSKQETDKARSTGCFPKRTDLIADEPTIAPLVAEHSNYFRLRTVIVIGTAQFALYSLMYRNGTQPRAVLRSFGTE
ncbi:MAG: type II secretion system minor pseudopilin GspK [Steroidobacteraceae bacterium]